MNNMKSNYISTLLIAGFFVLFSCNSEDTLDLPVQTVPVSEDPIDIYIHGNFVDKFGVAVRYKFVDRYVDPTKRVTPPKRDLVIPMLGFLHDFWIDPFLQVPNGKKFFEDHVPAEVIFIGSSIFNNDGTVTLGTADAGARITITDVNKLDTLDTEWILLQLNVIYHEFAHIMHQRHNLPPNWQTISPEGYTSAGSWYTLSNDEALARGSVSPYATSSFNEDFAETVAFFLFYPDFYDRYINDEVCTDNACIERNNGRAMIRKKYNAMLNHYLVNTGVDLTKVREIIQQKLPQ
jgi:substrate import-associated zinc metallohydrolase lipoprotein